MGCGGGKLFPQAGSISASSGKACLEGMVGLLIDRGLLGTDASGIGGIEALCFVGSGSVVRDGLLESLTLKPVGRLPFAAFALPMVRLVNLQGEQDGQGKRGHEADCAAEADQLPCRSEPAKHRA
jgi:hypothetical protein